MPAMVNPAVMFVVVVVLAAVSTSAAAAAGNSTASPSKNTTAPPPGTNHPVGDGTGWFFDWKANASAANYSTSATTSASRRTRATRWCTRPTRRCTSSAAPAAGGGSSGWKPEEAFLAVMLTTQGANYFFSGAWDGEHCRKGMRFEVAVAHGRGLPSVPPSYYEPLSGPPAGTRRGWALAVWVAILAALAVVLVL